MSFQYRKSQNLTKQCGAAIIVALFVVALVAAAATLMIERLRTDIRRTELILNANAATLYAQGSIAWAIDTLNNNLIHEQKNKVTDPTPIKSPMDKRNKFTIASVIYDAQGLFNINNLTDQQYQTNFTRLITIVAPEVEASNAQNITAAIVDWISPGSKNPATDEYYLKMNPSYRAAHRSMVSISELRLVKGITPELFKKLALYVTALPNVTSINVNNAPAPVLMSLSATMTMDAAKAIVATCQRTPFADLQKFLAFDIVKNNPIDATKLTVTSGYFLLETDVTVGSQTQKLYTLLERSATQDKKVKTIVLWQSKGTL